MSNLHKYINVQNADATSILSNKKLKPKGVTWAIPLDQHTKEKLEQIAQVTGGNVTRVVCFFIRYFIRKGLTRLIPKGAYLAPNTSYADMKRLNIPMVSVRTPAKWIKDLRDIAWLLGVRSNSYRHLAGYGIRLALAEHTVKFWQNFFFNGEDYILELYLWLDTQTQCTRKSPTMKLQKSEITPSEQK